MKLINKYLRVLIKNPPSVTQLRGDISGGVMSAILGISACMAYGMIVFAPLGPEFLQQGIVAALIGLAFANIGTALFSSNPIMI